MSINNQFIQSISTLSGNDIGRAVEETKEMIDQIKLNPCYSDAEINLNSRNQGMQITFVNNSMIDGIFNVTLDRENTSHKIISDIGTFFLLSTPITSMEASVKASRERSEKIYSFVHQENSKRLALNIQSDGEIPSELTSIATNITRHNLFVAQKLYYLGQYIKELRDLEVPMPDSIALLERRGEEITKNPEPYRKVLQLSPQDFIKFLMGKDNPK